MEWPWLVFIVHLFIYSANNYWGLIFSILPEAGAYSHEQNTVVGWRMLGNLAREVFTEEWESGSCRNLAKNMSGRGISKDAEEETG